MPSTEVIKTYVSDSAVKSILKFWISNLKSNHLEEDDDTLKTLKRFVRMAIEIHLKHIFNGDEKTRYGIDVLEKVKSERLKDVTKDIKVPSLSDLNLADAVEII
jgi:hypothetical protein